MSERALYFGAGPSSLPLSVLEEAAKNLINFKGTGIGIAEISHRTKEFDDVLTDLQSSVRTLLDVPQTHSILFAQGGGTAQFSAVVLNLLARYRLLHPNAKDEDCVMDYVLTGTWSRKASEEAKRLGGGRVNIAADARQYSKDGKSFDNIPSRDAYKFSPDPALIYYCENETIDGVQFSPDSSSPTSFPIDLFPKGALLPLVADYSSSFMSRKIPRIAEHAVIYAGAQKNIGPAGLTIIIVRQDCLVDVDAAVQLGATPVPLTMIYKHMAQHRSLYNTPSSLAIYMSGLVLQRMQSLGGLEYFEEVSRKKQEQLYAALKYGEEKGVLRVKVQEGSRSWMNVVFDVLGDGALGKFLAGAEANNLKGLKGHR
jgi:phosphoserine aminotransferase